jgi:tungstate transport system permease protein
LREAFALLVSGDAETWGIVGRSLDFAIFSTFFALFPGLSLGMWMARRETRPRRIAASIVGALMALPTVVIGLFVYTFISRSGPLGFLGFLYSPPGVILGQAILAFPVVASLTWVGMCRIDPRFHETIATLGAPPLVSLGATLREGAPVLAGALVSAFGRVTGEVGVAMMLGGNIRFSTRTMTTAIALDAAKGEFERAISLGIVLLFIALVVNFAVHALRPHER